MKISIVTPSYNQGRFIQRTLDSVASQAGVELDHYVADGGSTDGTVEILSGRGRRLKWVSERDGGQAHAVNKGIAATDGEIIGWLNSDDVYYPGALARVVEFFQRNPDVDVVYGDADHIDTEDLPFEAYPTEPWSLQGLKERCFICQPAAFIRRRALERYGVLDETLHYCMDYELWLRFGMAGAVFAHLPEKLAGSRLYLETKTMGSSIAVHREINGMLRATIGVVPDTWLASYAYMVTRDHVDEQAHPVRFTREMSARTLLAALRWNKAVSKSMMARLFPRWFVV